MRALASALACALAVGAYADSLVTGGYKEAVFSVSDSARYQTFFETVAGWETLLEDSVPENQLAAWQLPSDVSAKQILIGNPGTTRGYVRLIEFTGAEQVQIRSNAQTWDTGGWFDVNSRVVSMDSKFAEIQRLGWQSVSDPVQFSFGPFVVKEWLPRGPDGIVIALIERVQPALEGWPQMKHMSRLFNATQIVADIDAARTFYIEKLGFKVYLNHDGASDEPGPNVLGMPHNLATEVSRKISILHPEGINEGSVELIEFDGFDGADWSGRAVPPNLGILMLRFPVADMELFKAHIDNEQIEVVAPPTVVELAPYGSVKLMAIRGPGGAWIEFFEENKKQK